MKKLSISLVALLAMASMAMGGAVTLSWDPIADIDNAVDTTVNVFLRIAGDSEIDAAALGIQVQAPLSLSLAMRAMDAGMYFQPSGSASAWTDGLQKRGINVYNPSEDDPETVDEDEYVHLPVLTTTPVILARATFKVPAGTAPGKYALNTFTDNFQSGVAWAGTNLATTQATALITVTPEPATALLLLGVLPLLRRRR